MEASEETSAPQVFAYTSVPRVVAYNDETQKDHRGGREFSLYIKGIVEGMNRNVLTKEFSTFGTVKNLDVVPSKSCAFVEFNSQEAYQRALAQKHITIQDIGIVTVEERKKKETNQRGQRSRRRNRRDNTPTTSPESSSKHSKWYNNTQLAESPQLMKARSQRSNRDINRELSLYIKGIVDGMNKSVLEKAFSTFGAVNKLDVVPSKSCAFVEFCTKEAYQQALIQIII